MTTNEAAYLAGILDGEGHLAFFNPGRGRGRVRPEMQVESTDPELIAWLHNHVGGWLPSPVEPRGNRKKVYRWRCGGHECGRVARVVAPYMVIERKKKMAESMIGW